MALFSGMASAEYITKDNITLDMKQNVTGEGYFMSHKFIRMPNVLGISGTGNNGVEIMDYSHGSGAIDTDSILSATAKNSTNGVDENYGYDYTEALSCIQLKEDNSMIYSPVAVGIGSGYYAKIPLTFNSLIKEKTWLKNRGSATIMHHEVEYAHALDKEIEVLAKDFISEDDPAVSMMNVSEDMTNGRAHIGMLEGDPKAASDIANEIAFTAKSAWKSPLIDVDEDYWGTYHIEKLMNLTASVDETVDDDDWLPCCSGGFLTMPEAYQKGSYGFGSDVKGIFDCTCFTPPSRAELPMAG